MAGGTALGIYPLGAGLHGNAVQIHGHGLNAGDAFKAHVLGDDHGLRSVGAHTGSLPHGQHLHDGFLIQIGWNLVFFQQKIVPLVFRIIGEIKVAGPLGFSLRFHRFGTGAGIEHPLALVVFHQPEIGDGAFTHGFHQFDGFENHLGIGSAVGLAGLGGIPVKGHVVTGAVVSQGHHVGIVNGASHAVHRQGFGGFGLGRGGVGIFRLYHHAAHAEKGGHAYQEHHPHNPEHSARARAQVFLFFGEPVHRLFTSRRLPMRTRAFLLPIINGTQR